MLLPPLRTPLVLPDGLTQPESWYAAKLALSEANFKSSQLKTHEDQDLFQQSSWNRMDDLESEGEIRTFDHNKSSQVYETMKGEGICS